MTISLRGMTENKGMHKLTGHSSPDRHQFSEAIHKEIATHVLLQHHSSHQMTDVHRSSIIESKLMLSVIILKYHYVN